MNTYPKLVGIMYMFRLKKSSIKSVGKELHHNLPFGYKVQDTLFSIKGRINQNCVLYIIHINISIIVVVNK